VGRAHKASGTLPKELRSLAGLLWGLVILLIALWVVLKLVLGIAGALFHLLLVAAVVVVVYNAIKARASRRA
jgi:fatty acid desaturase